MERDGDPDETRSVRVPLVHRIAAARDRATAGRNAALSVLRSRLFPGMNAARYVLHDVLGEGGMGVVYRGYDRELERPVAVKLIRKGHEDGSLGRRELALINEAKSMAQLRHPNVVAVYDVGSFRSGDRQLIGDGTPDSGLFVVMELIDGVSLDRWLSARTRPVAQIVRTLLDAGRGLAAAHDAGVLHRDFKPTNVMVGSDGRVRVVDFGLATPTTSRTVPSGRPIGDDEALDTEDVRCPAVEIVGTPAYMAPEILAGSSPTPQGDVFAFGVTLFEALYGRRPHLGRQRAEIMNAIYGNDIAWPRRSERVPRKLHRVLERALAWDPDRRYASIDAVVADLQRWVRAPKPRSRTRPIAALAIAAGLSASVWGGAPAAGEAPFPTPWASQPRTLPSHAPHTAKIEALLETGRSGRAQRAALSLARAARRSGDIHAALRAELLQGRALVLELRRDEAIAVLERVFLDASSLERDAIARDAALELAEASLEDGQHEHTRQWIERTRVAATRIDSELDEATRVRLAVVQSRLAIRSGQCDQAAARLEQEPERAAPISTVRLALARLAAAVCLGDTEATTRYVAEATQAAAALSELHPLRAQLDRNIAQVQLARHEPEQAVATLQASHERLSSALGDDHVLAVRAACERGHMLVRAGRLEDAEWELEPCYQILRARLGPDRIEVAKVARTLGVIRNDRFAFGDAERYLRDAYAGYRASLGDRDEDVGYTALLLAVVESAQKRCDLAIEHSREALMILDNAGAPPFRRAASAYTRAELARACSADATDDLERALAIIDEHFGPAEALLTTAPTDVLALRGDVLLGLGRPALDVLEVVLERLQQSGSTGRVAGAKWALAQEIRQDQSQRARRLAFEAREVLSGDQPLLAVHIDNWLVQHWPGWARKQGLR